MRCGLNEEGRLCSRKLHSTKGYEQQAVRATFSITLLGFVLPAVEALLSYINVLFLELNSLRGAGRR